MCFLLAAISGFLAGSHANTLLTLILILQLFFLPVELVVVRGVGFQQNKSQERTHLTFCRFKPSTLDGYIFLGDRPPLALAIIGILNFNCDWTVSVFGRKCGVPIAGVLLHMAEAKHFGFFLLSLEIIIKTALRRTITVGSPNQTTVN